LTPLLDRVDSPRALRALPEDALPRLCEEIRQKIISVCGQVGGHLGASLGAVEMIVALHRTFKSPKDALVFDVGHQAYAHKILTGRGNRMETLRKAGGIAPFLDPQESSHDAIGAGHACTAISSALGIVESKRLQGIEGTAVAVIGDGSLTGGLSFEGLNNAAACSAPLAIVLNDNGMSISVNVGAVSKALRTSEARFFFESLGFTYLGPVDGHDLGALLAAFREARRSHKSIVVHLITRKGKGFSAAEEDSRTRGHAMGPYEMRDGKLVRSRGGKTTFSEAFAAALEERMATDGQLVVVTPAMLEGSALVGVATRFPSRVYDVGIAEQHAVTFSAGLAIGGLRPVCCIYSTFLQRALDQVIHDVCLPKLPVVFAIDRAGLVGADGATHQGAYDLPFLRAIPNLAVVAPVVGEDLKPLLRSALQLNGPCAIRFPRGTLPVPPPLFPVPEATVSGARWLKQTEGATLTIVALGPLALAALQAAQGKSWNVLDARFVSPLDAQAIRKAATTGRMVVVEEGTIHGGLGSAILELLAQEDLAPRVRQLGLPHRFLRHGDAPTQRAELGLDADGIRSAAEALF